MIKNRSFLQLEITKEKKVVKEDLLNSRNLRKESVEKEQILNYNGWEGSRRQIKALHRKPKERKKGADKMELTYKKMGDYLIPDIEMDEQPEGELRKYGLMRKQYLKEHKEGIYTALLFSNKLMQHLLERQEEAEERLDCIVKQMAKIEGMTEELKSNDPLAWIQGMNSIHHRAEEIILEELIYH